VDGRYDAEVRELPRAQPGIRVERTPQLTRLTGAFNFVLAWRGEAQEAQALANARAEEFRARGSLHKSGGGATSGRTRRGARWLTVGGNANSAPRLSRLGFVELSPTECWLLPAPARCVDNP
jgi:hypothetical protein